MLIQQGTDLMEDNENMPAQVKEESNITKKETKQHDVPFTQVPNQIMDTMPMRTPAENLVLFAICRKTYGWQKTRDQISISQIMKLTGISKQGVLNCLKSLKANLWIESDKDDYGNIIYIPLEKTKEDLLIPRIEPEKWKKISNRSKPENSGRKKGQTIGLVKPVDRSNHLTGGSQTSLPEFSESRSNHLTGGSQTIGHTKETLNKEKEEIKDKERETEKPAPSLPEKP
jgi:phage replication O-like protein O